MPKSYEPVQVKSYRGTLLDGVTECEPSLEMSKTIDWSNNSDRKWLMSHLTWAVHNGREVRLFGMNQAPSSIN